VLIGTDARLNRVKPQASSLFNTVVISTADRVFVECFVGMNGTFELIFACKKDTAIAGNLMQFFELEPIFLEGVPARPTEIDNTKRHTDRKSHCV
jgi:hypothetical protein